MDSTSSSTDLTTWSHPVPLLLCSLKLCLLLLAFLIWIRYFPLTPVPLLRHRGTGETGARKPKLWEGWWPRGCVQISWQESHSLSGWLTVFRPLNPLVFNPHTKSRWATSDKIRAVRSNLLADIQPIINHKPQNAQTGSRKRFQLF